MRLLARHLRAGYCGRAAGALWRAHDRVLLTTGFYIASADALETDGPPGTFFLARGLAACGAQVGFVAEDGVLALLESLSSALWTSSLPAPEFLPFPITSPASGSAFAEDLVKRWQPTAVVAIERCGRNARGLYLNRSEQDISAYTAPLDDIVSAPGAVSVGVGDGGNEIGMGSVADYVMTEIGRTSACAVRTDHLVLADVSNWGAFGLLAYLSRLAGRDLLPTAGEEKQALDLLAGMGAVNAMSGKAEPAVDGFSLDEDLGVLAELRTQIQA
jgi:hypothetical protein